MHGQVRCLDSGRKLHECTLNLNDEGYGWCNFYDNESFYSLGSLIICKYRKENFVKKHLIVKI